MAGSGFCPGRAAPPLRFGHGGAGALVSGIGDRVDLGCGESVKDPVLVCGAHVVPARAESVRFTPVGRPGRR